MHLTPEELVDAAEIGTTGATAAHLESCAVCREHVDVLKAALSSAAAVDVPEPSPLFWDRLSARVREGVAAEDPRGRAWNWAALLPVSWSTAAIVGVAAAVLVALYVTVPRERPPAAQPQVALDAPADVPIQPFGALDDPSLAFVADLTQQMDPDVVAGAGWTNHAGGVEEALANLTNDERFELQRLLKDAIEKRDAS